MIRSVEFDLETKSEANQRFASRAGMFAKSERVKAQRSAVKQVLASTFGAHMPPLHVVLGNVATPNRIEVRLVRLAPGLLDDDNLRGALKAVRDAVAAWIGIDDRDARATWGYDQAKAAQHVYRVRIEVEDLSPGEPRRVVLAEAASAGRVATSRVKREVRRATRDAEARRLDPRVRSPQQQDADTIARRGAVLSYQPEATARGASSAARGRAEAAFAKLTGKPTTATKPPPAMAGDVWCRCPACGHAAPLGEMQDTRGMLQCAKCGSRHGVSPHRPTATDLRDAAERALSAREQKNILAGKMPKDDTRPHDWRCPTHGRKCTMKRTCMAGEARRKGGRDPGEEARPEALADCVTCGAKVPERCTRIGVERLVFGVHEARARAAGLHVPADDRAQVRPARPSVVPVTRTGNPRRVATVPGQARLVARRVFLAPPWEPRNICEACSGSGNCRVCFGAGTHPIDAEQPECVCATALGRCMTCGGSGFVRRVMFRQPQVEDVGFDEPVWPWKVPIEHRGRWGASVTLYRREVTIPAHGLCWVYEAARQEGT